MVVNLAACSLIDCLFELYLFKKLSHAFTVGKLDS
jgi:hypothetical protein